MSRLMDVRESICLEKTIGNTYIYPYYIIISQVFPTMVVHVPHHFPKHLIRQIQASYDIQLLFRYFYWILISEQIGIIPKPELRGFWGDSLTKPPFKVTSAEVVIIWAHLTVCLTDLPFNHSSTWETHQNHPATVTSVVKAASPFRPLFESLGNHASVDPSWEPRCRSHFHHFST